MKLVSKEPVDLGNGLGVKDAVRIAIMDGPGRGENFWYARNFGWVAFGHAEPPDGLNIRLEQAAVSPGQNYWRLIKAIYHDPTEPFNPALPGGDHHIYIEIVDEQGKRMVGQKAVVKNGGTTSLTIEDKLYPDYGCNFAMYGRLGSYSAWADGMPSDKVTGVGLPMKQHLTFYLIFQRMTK